MTVRPINQTKYNSTQKQLYFVANNSKSGRTVWPITNYSVRAPKAGVNVYCNVLKRTGQFCAPPTGSTGTPLALIVKRHLLANIHISTKAWAVCSLPNLTPNGSTTSDRTLHGQLTLCVGGVLSGAMVLLSSWGSNCHCQDSW